MNESTKKIEKKFHLVFGGELKGFAEIDFKDLAKIDFVGIFADEKSAHQAWKAKSQASVDNAHMRYFVVPLYKFLQNSSKQIGQPENEK